MKFKTLFLSLMAAATLFSACKDDNDDISPDNLSAHIKSTIQTMYPNARITEADREHNGITEVDIWHDNKKKEVRFTASEEWIETEYDVLRQEVPAAVLETLATRYPNPVIDDIDCYETPGGKYYRFEVIVNNQEIKMNIQEDGTAI